MLSKVLMISALGINIQREENKLKCFRDKTKNKIHVVTKVWQNNFSFSNCHKTVAKKYFNYKLPQICGKKYKTLKIATTI